MEIFKKKKKDKINIEKISDFLPIGSIVKLTNNRKYLIFGFAQSYSTKPNDQYDYIGVPYPEGNFCSDEHTLFDHSDIFEIIHRGYTDEDYDDFVEMMEAMMKM